MDKGIPCEKCLEETSGNCLHFAAISVLKRTNTTAKGGLAIAVWEDCRTDLI